MSAAIPDPESSRRAATRNLKAAVRDLPPRLKRLEEDSVLRAGDADRSLFDRLEQFYRSVDEVLEFVLRRTPCRRGCCGCCHYRVELFGIEAAYLARALRIRRDTPALPIAETHGLPCPFLSNGECMVYRNRPYSCRKHMTFDRSSYWCQPCRANTIDLPLVRFTKFDEAMAVLALQSGDGGPWDIRDVFPTGLLQKKIGPPVP